jgi:hypothetical protein
MLNRCGCAGCFCGTAIAASESRAGNEPMFEAVTETAPQLNVGGESVRAAVFGLNRPTITGAVDPITETKATNKARMVVLSANRRRQF